ncbi:tRNA 2-thiouridine(34) synthase MnmA [bacterium]|nr:tRNA 2-thiouridine(34) synthase MnmA [bacterium]
MTKVAVALSGGIDSAVVAALLLENGYQVVGITGKMFCDANSEEIVSNAKCVADKLGIEHFVLDLSKEFEKNVINYFENSYKLGETPNPCVMCNKHIKWGFLLDYAINVLKADFFATGHYANIKCEDGVYKLYPALDEEKDQLYFLFQLSQDQLSKTVFPLSGYKKSEVREFAEKYNLPSKSSKESQDICFIKPPMTTKKYLNEVFANCKGFFVEKNTEKILGTHDGYWQYTIGQRKGIGIAAPKPLYVLDIDAVSNTVYVGYKDDLKAKYLSLKNVVWCSSLTQDKFEALVKVRYNMKAVRAVVHCGEIVEIIFKEEVLGITPGQACVIYELETGALIGGGFIEK